MTDAITRPVRLGVVGLGRRARGLINNLLDMKDVEISAICDIHEEKLMTAMELFETAGRPLPRGYIDIKPLLAREDIEGVLIATSWTSHIRLAIEAMKAGKYAAMEVGPAASLTECWDLVAVSEQTGVPCMLLENCNYGRTELALLNMVKQGVFGELIHCQCGYEHDLRRSLITGYDNGHYRIHHYLHRNGDNYPTHGIGPVAKYLNINRGNQFLTLTSMSSKSRGLREWVAEHLGNNHPLARADVRQGDIVTTIIKCAHGETIVLNLDTTLPRPYSRAGRVQGTKGIWMEAGNSIYLEGRSPDHTWEAFEAYRDEYEHPLWKRFIAEGIRGGHGGMDYLCLRAFVDSIARNVQTPIDVYDTAAWMAIAVLSEQSIALGGQAVAFPDFTKGRWITRSPGPASAYSLDVVDQSLVDDALLSRSFNSSVR